jgi:hypothetical protein
VPPVADFLIERAALIATPVGPAPKRGITQRDIVTFHDGVVASRAGVIVYVGPASDVTNAIEIAPHATRVDASGCTSYLVSSIPTPMPSTQATAMRNCASD